LVKEISLPLHVQGAILQIREVRGLAPQEFAERRRGGGVVSQTKYRNDGDSSENVLNKKKGQTKQTE
jgi:hypothetical protein